MLEVEITSVSKLAGRVPIARTRNRGVIRAVARVCLRELYDLGGADPGLAPVAEGQRAALAAALRAAGVEMPEPRGCKR